MTGETGTLCDIVTWPDVIFRYDSRDRVRDRDRNRDRERNRDRDFRKRKNQRPLRPQYKVGESIFVCPFILYKMLTSSLRHQTGIA